MEPEYLVEISVNGRTAKVRTLYPDRMESILKARGVFVQVFSAFLREQAI